jgi:membrane-bound serine protease (ClpP class)
MAPLTNIGAAHPVDASGSDIQGDLRLKAENDAVAQIRNIATARGHNADWAEQAVRKSVSIGADEAVTLKVADLIAANVADLLRKADGREITLPQGTVRLATAGAAQDEDPFTPFERLLHFVTNPQVAILLFTLGTYGLIFELSNPSLIFPGVVGVIAILLALFAFGTLDANGAGIALLLFAVLLFLSELWVPSHGILTAGGVAAIVVGAIILFPPGRPTLPGLELQVPPLTIAAVGGASAVFFVVIARGSLHYRRLSAASTSPTLVGSLGIAKSDVDRSGIVHVAGEDWSATSAAGPISRGEEVRVNAVDGLRLLVSPAKGKEGV